ncbi:MAG TPA: sigma-54-dependent Fis family transcriptional regulator, partial [Desulfobacteraceae bacterium]|nr:sigma-54-dependent Fis family transcriptional regulator [Desulfobacteraceae bacterium]
ERLDDIPELVEEFQQELVLNANIEQKRFSDGALDMLRCYDWPGNVRELKNLVERLLIMTRGKAIEARDIPAPYNKSSAERERLGAMFMEGSLRDARSEFEKLFIEARLKQCGGNISQTAEAIGMERSSLHKKIKAYGLEGIKSDSND